MSTARPSPGSPSWTIRLVLEAESIDFRPAWKPMHLQRVFRDCRVRSGAVSEELFARGLCLPSGTAMTEGDLGRVVEGVRRTGRAGCRVPGSVSGVS
ncbi:MAG: DegT/DnrJ/EryC1/StrS family aminotransferase [Thermodesulfobacteriota bacterium]